MPTATRSAAGSKAPAPARAGTKTMKSPRLLACALLALVICGLMAPQLASASSTQLSLLQDDSELSGERGESADAAMAEIRGLGVDVLRTNVIFNKVVRNAGAKTKPAGFVASDPNSPQYNWAAVDHLVNSARANGLKLLLTVTGPGPNWTSSQPSRCKKVPCSWKPKPADFGGFTAAVAKRYRGKVDYYSLYNEGNIGKTWLSPRFARSGKTKYDFGGALYRKLYIAGYKSIAKFDPGKRNSVLFGETAAISQPLPYINAALCLDKKGKPFKGKLKKLQGCSGKVSKISTAGFAIHPYNSGGNGTPRTKSKTKTSLSLAYLPRLYALNRAAARRGRISGNRPVFITEFGYQSKPPDKFSNVSPTQQGQYINESDRLFYSDRRIKSVSQYELVDVPQKDQFNTGLRFVGGKRKPAYADYEVPAVVTKRSSKSVEVYGQVRPARVAPGGSRTTVAVQVASGGSFTTVKNVRTNSRGIFKVNISRAGASKAKWRLSWQNPGTGQFLTSRIAKAGKKLRYYKG
jgi:hypothetical protein